MSAYDNTSADQVNTQTQKNSTPLQAGPKQEFFAWLPNCIIYDWGLSAEAIATALYLNGKPTGWQARPFDIRAHFKWGEHRWEKISKELRGCGLLTLHRTKSGSVLMFQLPEMSMTIQKKPTRDFPGPGKPEPGKPRLLAKKDIPEKDHLSEKDLFVQNNDVSESVAIGGVTKMSSLSKAEIQAIFDKMWDTYPLKKAKQKALQALEKAFKGKARGEAESLCKVIWSGLAAAIAEHSTKQQLVAQGGDVWVPELPHLVTWINQSRWEDDYQHPSDILNSAKRKSGPLDLSRVFN